MLLHVKYNYFLFLKLGPNEVCIFSVIIFKYITKFWINIHSYVLICGCPRVRGGGGVTPPIRYDGDMPRLDCSRVHGEVPSARLPVLSHDGGGGGGNRET